jgi:hypothetical protein
MARILLQTTIPYTEDDWHVGRFELLAEELRAAGHDVTARDRSTPPGVDDPILSTLDSQDFEELWLMAVDAGDGLTTSDGLGIRRFREGGGGVLTARDHADVGACLCDLGSLGRVNHFHGRNPEPDAEPDDQDNPSITWPNYHSGANGDYQPVFPSEPVHDLLRSESASDGRIADFPAHPHEGAVSAPADVPEARVVAQGRSTVSGRRFNLVVTLEGETTHDDQPMGRAVAVSSFHQFADINWDVDRGGPSFVIEPPGEEIKKDPSRLEIFKDYVRNLARWLKG